MVHGKSKVIPCFVTTSVKNTHSQIYSDDGSKVHTHTYFEVLINGKI